VLDLHVGLPETSSLNSRHVTLYAMQILVIFWTCRLNVISAAVLLSERHFFLVFMDIFLYQCPSLQKNRFVLLCY